MDHAANARSLGARVYPAPDLPSLPAALAEARRQECTTVIVVQTDREVRVPAYESWWDVPVPEVSALASVRQAREAYEEAVERERHYL